jgi:hypothetical protein
MIRRHITYIAGDFPITATTQPVVDGWGFGSYWNCEHWIMWHKAMVALWGKPHANYKFKKCWEQPENQNYFSGSAWDSCSSLVTYMKSQGVTIERNTVLDTLVGWKDNITKVAVPVGLALAGVYVYFNYINTPTRRLAQAINRIPRVSGINSKQLAVYATVGGGAALLAYNVISSQTATGGRTYMGLPLTGTARTYEHLNQYGRNLSLLMFSWRSYALALKAAFDDMPDYAGVFVKGTDNDLWDAMKEWLSIMEYWNVEVIDSRYSQNSTSGDSVIDMLKNITA